MKKLMVLFLAFAVTAVAFAQAPGLSVEGQLHMGFHGRILGGDDQRFPGLPAGHTPPAEWNFSFLNTGTWVAIAGSGQNSSARLWFRGNNTFRGWAWANVGDGAEIGIGYVELPWVQWSPISFDNQSNHGIGAGASTVHPYFMARFTVAPGMRVYAGLTEGGAISNEGPGPGTLNPNNEMWSYGDWGTPFPGFFAGFEVLPNALGPFSAGLAFAGQARSAPADAPDNIDGLFAFMINAHGRVLDVFGPGSRIGVNLAIYQNPEMGFFAVAHTAHTGPVARVGGIVRQGAAAPLASRWEGLHNEDLMVLEAMVDFILPLEGIGTFALAYGIVTNFDGDSDALGMQVAGQLTVPFGNGFSLIPGVLFRMNTNHAGYTMNTTDIGVHMRFSW